MRCRRARELIPLYLAPDESWLSPENRQALEAHMAVCESCRRDCQETRAALELLRDCWQISKDTAALLRDRRTQTKRGVPVRILEYLGTSRRVAGWAVAACLVIAVLGSWALLSRYGSSSKTDGAAALSENWPVVVVFDDGTPIAPGAVIQTSTGETKSLVLNNRHQVEVNAGSRLSIGRLMEAGKIGILVNLTLGEVCMHVEYDGNPFVVQTAHGRAVVTGTTFDVKTTDAGATLVVSEGSVRFESDAGAVQVTAGQRSVIRAAATSPSVPESCDTTALTAWANTSQSMMRVAQDADLDSLLQDDLPLPPSPWGQVQTDLDSINYVRWVEQKRDWFARQFPWIFELQDALRREGIDVSYPDLLIQSGDLWRFTYPAAALCRQNDPDPNGLLKAAACHGRDEAWFQQQAFASLRLARREKPAIGLAAFDQWAEAVKARVTDYSTDSDSQIFSDSLDASLYLANIRTLAILVVEGDAFENGLRTKDELARLLREELQVLAGCAGLPRRVDLAGLDDDSCDSAEGLSALIVAIREIAELEKDVRKHEELIRVKSR